MTNLLVDSLTTPQNANSYNIKEWELLIRQARAAKLLGRLNYLLTQHKIAIPKQAKWHFNSAESEARKQHQQFLHEFIELNKLFIGRDNISYLKGAAYFALKLPCYHGRVASDIDILVKKDRLKAIELNLRFNNWVRTKIDDYDEHYYRTWMHEIPPLQHAERQTVIDVHHNILPLTNDNCPNVEEFQFQKVQLSQELEITTLSNYDLTIHTMVHLFTEGEFDSGLRDLSDIDMLIRHFTSIEQDFVEKLWSRAQALNLNYDTFLALRYANKVFNTPTDINLKPIDGNIKNEFQLILLDFAFTNIFKPNHKSCRNMKFFLAKHTLYLRGHLLKMPLRLLIPHLIKKSWKRIQELRKEGSVPNEKLMP